MRFSNGCAEWFWFPKMLIWFEHILLHDLYSEGLGTSSEKLRTPSPNMFNTIQTLSINDNCT